VFLTRSFTNHESISLWDESHVMFDTTVSTELFLYIDLRSNVACIVDAQYVELSYRSLLDSNL
jgi:hypothetical protein